jgi:hypothetical protein
MAFASIHDRVHGRKEITSPLGAKPIDDLPKHGVQADWHRVSDAVGWGGWGACRRCTSAHSAAMRASCSGPDRRFSPGRLSMAA